MIPPSKLLAAALLLASAGSLATGVDPALPRYEPRAIEVARSAPYVTAEGAIAVVGYNDMRDMMEALAKRFSAAHPGVRFALDLRGTRFAPAALASGASAFAPMGAEFTAPQLAEYRARAGHDPIGFRVAHASLEPRALSGPLAIFVHRDNPMASITMEGIRRVFTGEATRWGDLGLQGDWAARAIRPVGLQEGTALAHELQEAAMPGRAFAPEMKGVPQSAEVVARVSADRSSIGFAAAMRSTPAVRIVPVAAGEGGEPVAPTKENITAGRYPLDRHLLIFASRPLTPLAREFLRLALSREGQQAIAASPQGYLPLSARDAARERAKLD